MGKVKVEEFRDVIIRKQYQFPMGKVKLREEKRKSPAIIVSIPYGKGKAYTILVFVYLNYCVSIPYGKGKENTPNFYESSRNRINSLWER